MTTPAKQKVIGIDVSKDTLAICHQPEDKIQHLETETIKLASSNLLNSAARTVCL